MMKRTIAGLAMDGGVGVETVRYYQRRGLLCEPERPIVSGVARGVRTYGDADVQRLHFIRRAQAAGFQLKEIKQLLAFQAADNRAGARGLARARVAALDREIAELTAAREALAALARACSARSKGPCPILAAFDQAATRRRLHVHRGVSWRGAGDADGPDRRQADLSLRGRLHDSR